MLTKTIAHSRKFLMVVALPATRVEYDRDEANKKIGGATSRGIGSNGSAGAVS
jgi:hypothetical protein